MRTIGLDQTRVMTREPHPARGWKTWLMSSLLTLTVRGWADSPLQWRGSKGWEAESAYCRLYDAHSVVTLTGTVMRVEKITPMKGMGSGVHLILKTDLESIPVQLGPTWYVEKQQVQISARDVVEVTGSRVSCDGKPVIMAAFIKKGDGTATYRDIKGIPAWAGQSH